LLDLIRSAACQHQVEVLGGYDTTHMGQVIAEIPAVRGYGVSD
jgi:hypothetical protein